MPLSPEARSARARLAGTTRWHGSSAEAEEARRQLREVMLMDCIRELADTCPPFGPEQRLRIAAILCNPGLPGWADDAA